MITEDGVDNGYLADKNWWNNPEHPHAFRICVLDEDYPKIYYTNNHQLDNAMIEAYCNGVIAYYPKFTNRPLETIIEFGSAGSWFTNRFRSMGYTITALDGGSNATSNIQHDFRHVFVPERKYDIALCTEVAEHLEPPFAGILVHNLIQSSDLIWWSSAEIGRGPAHFHHPNEQPYKYWINIFEYFGYGCYMLPDEIYNACASRGRCIFYNKAVYTPPQ